MSADITNRSDCPGAASREPNTSVKQGREVEPRLLDIHDSARYIAASEKVVRQMLHAGELPYVQRFPGRSPYLIDRADLDAWIDARKQYARM